ncbi:MAG: outer membrane lipoprotein carrier protein LolA [Bacteroidales bacterium]|nr:outer membrane lipoprotein carrier protein LolA [Bacteroidales bacterium]
MQKITIIHILVFTACTLMAQQDPEAKKILDRVALKTKSYSTIQADFELTIENRRENKVSRTNGSIKIKGDKYYMESPGSKVYFDGVTLYTFQEDINEVVISIPDTNENDFVEDPSKIFDFYNRDFKYRLIGEVKLDEGWMYEIDLFPKNLDQPYSRFKVLINKDTDELFIIKAIGKDGIDYSASLFNAKYNADLENSIFTFQPENHKNIEIVDLRF